MMTPCLAPSAAGSHTICDPSGEDRGTMFIVAPATVLRYDHKHDAWQQLPASGAAGTFGAGACGTYHPYGASGNARAGGTTSTVPTSLNIPFQLNYHIRFIGGVNAGQERQIVGNTIGANSVLTLNTPLPAACVELALLACLAALAPSIRHLELSQHPAIDPLPTAGRWR